jgi:hypothetical protein
MARCAKTWPEFGAVDGGAQILSFIKPGATLTILKYFDPYYYDYLPRLRTKFAELIKFTTMRKTLWFNYTAYNLLKQPIFKSIQARFNACDPNRLSRRVKAYIRCSNILDQTLFFTTKKSKLLSYVRFSSVAPKLGSLQMVRPRKLKHRLSFFSVFNRRCLTIPKNNVL